MARKQSKKPEPEKNESVEFLLTAAENCVRDAMQQAVGKAHSVQIETLSDILLNISNAKVYFGQDPEFFDKRMGFDDE